MNTILTVDAAGRVVLPKPLRDRLGLCAGSELQLREDGAEIHLRSVANDSPLKEVNGFLVYTGESTASAASELQQVREARLRRLSGR
jgi:AbrB family looped-hinge helix DNA binding protein